MGLWSNMGLWLCQVWNMGVDDVDDFWMNSHVYLLSDLAVAA